MVFSEEKAGKTLFFCRGISCTGKILLALIAAAIIVRIAVFFILPESAYSDALFHIQAIKDSVMQGSVRQTDLFTTPLYYFFGFVLFKGLNLPFSFPFVKIMPLIFTLGMFAVVFLISKRLFKKYWLFPIAFLAVFPWFIRYNLVNYTEVFASFFVLCFLYLFLKFEESKTPAKPFLPENLKFLSLFFAVIVLAALSKILVTVMVPFMVLFLGILLYRKKFSLKFIIPFLAIILFFSFVWFVCLNQTADFKNQTLPDVIFSPKANLIELVNPQNLALSYLSFFDFPPAGAFAKIPLLKEIPYFWSAALFAIIVLPLLFLILRGLKANLKNALSDSKSLFYMLLFVLAIVGFLEAIYYNIYGIFNVRYFFPSIPLIALIMGLGFEKLAERKNAWKAVVLASLVLFAVFSFAQAIVSSSYYEKEFSKNKELYSAASLLPENALIASNKYREFWYYADVNSKHLPYLQIPGNSCQKVDFNSAESIYSGLKCGNFTHLATTCYASDVWNEKALKTLQDDGRLKLVFSKDCTRLFEVK